MAVSSRPKQMGIQHMANPTSPEEWEPQRINNFEVQITGLKGSDDVLLSVAQFSPPDVTIEALSVHYGNNSMKVAGKPSYGEATIIVNDYIGKDIQGILQAWFREVYNEKTQEIGFAANYKKSGSVTEFAPDGSLPRSWTLKGVWPSSFQLGEFSQEGNGLRQITMTLQVDWCALDE